MKQLIEYANQVFLNPIRDAFLRENGGPTSNESTASWITSILTGKEQSEFYSKSKSTLRNRLIGSNRIDNFGWLTLRDKRSYLIPLNSRQASTNALNLYNAQTSKAKAAKRFLKIGLEFGVAQPFLRRFRLPAYQGVPEKYFPKVLLMEHIRKLLGKQDLSFGISLGTLGPHRKPVLLALSSKGKSLGYIKVGWNEQTRHLVKNENRALRILNSYHFRHGSFPRPIYFGNWNDKCILITEPLLLQTQYHNRVVLERLHIKFLTELAQVDIIKKPFLKSDFYLNLTSRHESIKSCTPQYQLKVIEETIDILTSSFNSLNIPWVWRLGDFTPWNTGIDKSSDKILCIDIEYAGNKSVPGWDIFHFLSQPLQKNKDQIFDINSTNYSLIRPYFLALNIIPDVIPLLHIAYLLDLWTNWAQAWKLSNKPKSAEATKVIREKLTLLTMLTEAIKRKRIFLK